MQTIRYLIAAIIGSLASISCVAAYVINSYYDRQVTLGPFGAKIMDLIWEGEAGDQVPLSDCFAMAWILLTIVTYICGGLITAVKMAVEFALKGLVIPLPWMLFAVVLMGFGAICLFIFLPIIPVLRAMRTYS